MTTSSTQPHSARRLYVSMLVSLDGFIEGPNKDLSWFLESPQFDHYCDEMLDSVDLALYGRRAYELMVSYWPNAEQNPRTPSEQQFARKMNQLPKLVLSRTLEQVSWSNTRILKDGVAEELTRLKQQPGKSIVAWAGAGLLTSLMRLKLVDELRLIVHPILLGSGTALFQDIEPRTALRLVRTTQLGEGLAVLCYEPSWK